MRCFPILKTFPLIVSQVIKPYCPTLLSRNLSLFAHTVRSAPVGFPYQAVLLIAMGYGKATSKTRRNSNYNVLAFSSPLLSLITIPSIIAADKNLQGDDHSSSQIGFRKTMRSNRHTDMGSTSATALGGHDDGTSPMEVDMTTNVRSFKSPPFFLFSL